MRRLVISPAWQKALTVVQQAQQRRANHFGKGLNTCDRVTASLLSTVVDAKGQSGGGGGGKLTCKSLTGPS